MLSLTTSLMICRSFLFHTEIIIEPNKWYRLRVSMVVPSAAGADLNFSGGSCVHYKVAADGVWHSNAFDYFGGSSFPMTGVSRADFAIKCTSSGNTVVKWGNQQTAATIVTGDHGLGDNDSGSIVEGA